ncbi:MAG: YesL family protein [Lachnospira sp.]
MFSINGKFFKALTKAGDFLILGLIMVIFSLPIITIGASVTSAFYVGMKLVRDEEGYVFKGFIKSFKMNFKQSLIIELIIALLGAILFTDIRICLMWSAKEGGIVSSLLLYTSIGFMLVLIAVTMYVFPMLAKFSNTVFGTLKNALLLCMHHLPQTFIMLMGTVGLTYFSLMYFTAFIITIPVMLYIDSYILARIFLKYINQDNEQGIAENGGQDV